MKTCSVCHQEKPLSEFYKVKKNKDGYCGYCISCDKAKKAANYLANTEAYKARAAAWTEENRERSREFKRNWKRKNPDSLRQYKHKRRAKESVEHFTAEEWRALLDAAGHKCLACGSMERLSADHIIPLALGGSNGIENIQPLCVDCNCKKGKKVIDYREI
jgi:5-methylcytosine-specific restriction endonuclease McrA